MRQPATHTALFGGDLLAIALACIVSLLFAQGVCQFLNTTKKNNYNEISAMTNPSQQRTEICLNDFYVTCYVIRAVRKETSAVDFVAGNTPYQFIKTTIANVLDKGLSGIRTSPFYLVHPPLLPGPSIPIAQRRLVI